MKTILEINRILIYSETNDKYFYTEFKKGLNVIYGRNTSGKSTLIQLLLYSFGINDNKIKLSEILAENIFIRLDCNITRGSATEAYTFVRQDETLLIKDSSGKVIRFNGIASDQSREHVKLKEYFHKLFHFSLLLEGQNGLVHAPIETIFLPYYISQDVGWVYLRKSFNNLTFYKGFKEDFLDYYLGIENFTNKDEKRKLENKIKDLNQQIKFFVDFDKKNEEIEVSKVIDDSIAGKANELIEIISTNKDEVMKLESKYVNESNLLSFYTQRASVVSKVKRNHEKQYPGHDNCPTCAQTLPVTLEGVYGFYQAENDTVSMKLDLNDKIKKVQAELNSLNMRIEGYRKQLQDNYRLYQTYSESNLTLETWVNNKANIQLYNKMVSQIGELKISLEAAKDEMKQFKTEQEILNDRAIKNSAFKSTYFRHNTTLGVSKVDDDRFYKVYELSSFPFQGVELHLAVLSYHFSFNQIINSTQYIHRLPLILDSVFKEDLEPENKTKILRFITTNAPNDTQTIISIADSKRKESKIDEYSRDIFTRNTNLICIGDGTEQKALLKANDGLQSALIDDTFEIIETI